jgi:hypothetical protein
MSEAAAAWAGALATLLAVLVALFGTAWERRRSRPVLDLGTGPADLRADAMVIHIPDASGDERVWLRLTVMNRGRSTAEAVRLVLLGMAHSGGGSHHPPMRELKWADVPFETVTLAPHEFRLVDLLHVASPAGGAQQGVVPGVVQFEGDPEVAPGHRLWWPASTGRYTFRVALSARDVPARRFEVELDLDVARPFDPAATVTQLRNARVTPKPWDA